MVIHSVTPVEFLMSSADPQNQPCLETRQVQGGYLEGYQTAQGFQVSRLLSTDPSMYLRYSPGEVYPEAKMKV